MKKITILGSTGSIGCSTLDVIRKSPGSYQVLGLAAGYNAALLKEQIREFNPEMVSCIRSQDADLIKNMNMARGIAVHDGDHAAEELAGHPDNDIVVSAITGINGLRPTVAAVRQGKTVALANKESMVTGGSLLKDLIRRSGANLIPVDSEHSGVFQCLASENGKYVAKVILTASGGPFFKSSDEEMEHVTVDQALAHPRWKMGKKVTIDSATMMNKGLELIEARWLFDLQPSQLHMLIHPQSIVHSLVEMTDGSILAQMSPTDMKIPIQFALTYPERGGPVMPSLDLAGIRAMEFYDVDLARFPLAGLALDVLKSDPSYSVVLNAANEVVVNAFLAGDLSFSEMATIVRDAVERHVKVEMSGFDDVFAVDRETRTYTRNVIMKR